MYNLTCVDGYKHHVREELYFLDIIPLAAGLAATSSDQKLSLFDPRRLSQGPLRSIQTNHGNLTCAKVFNATDSILCTAGENGTVSVWDLRVGTDQNPEVLNIGGKDLNSLLKNLL